MKKIISIVGARPQFIKTPLISEEIRKFAQEIIVHTGQHYDDNMSDVFFRELKIPKPDYNLGVGSATQGKQTGQMLEKIEQALLKENPDLVIIYGDTNSTVAGALAAAKLHIPVAHVEAGMRSYNREMPEEINRVVSDHISDLLFAPTKSSAEILKKEGINKGVYFVGDVMYDIQKKLKAQSSPTLRSESDTESRRTKLKNTILKKYNIGPKKYLLATVHRQENTDSKENLTKIIKAFIDIAEPIIFPLHPRTKKYLKIYQLDKMILQCPYIRLIDPVGFLVMLTLENNARIILTDSGGIQKEAYWARVPCVTLRQETEWVETVQSGWNQLVGTDIEKIVHLVNYFPQPKSHPNFFGDGRACEKIAEIINKFIKK